MFGRESLREMIRRQHQELVAIRLEDAAWRESVVARWDEEAKRRDAEGRRREAEAKLREEEAKRREARWEEETARRVEESRVAAEEAREFNREMLLRNEKVYVNVLRRLEEMGEEIRANTARVAECTEETRAQTRAVLKLIDRFDGPGGRAAA